MLVTVGVCSNICLCLRDQSPSILLFTITMDSCCLLVLQTDVYDSMVCLSVSYIISMAQCNLSKCRCLPLLLFFCPFLNRD